MTLGALEAECPLRGTEGLTADGIEEGKRERGCRPQEYRSEYIDNYKVLWPELRMVGKRRVKWPGF